MSLYEERQHLVSTAKELAEELRKLATYVNRVVNELLSTADTMLPEVADEVQGQPKIRKIKMTVDKPQLDEIVASLGAGKRACSICRKPGHRATTCPQRKK